jgi:general nucleoside transport system permease protein
MSDRWRSHLESVCLPLGALIAALVIFGLFCALAGANPFGVYSSIYRAAFGSWSSFQNTLIQASPLMLSALCTALPARLGLVIIGNEGALVLGGLAAVAGGLTLGGWGLPTPGVQLGMALAGMAAGGIWIAIVGALRHYRAVNETISSLLMNYIAIAFLNQMVNGPMKDPASLNKPSSYPMPDDPHAGQSARQPGALRAGAGAGGLWPGLLFNSAHHLWLCGPHRRGQRAGGAGGGAACGQAHPGDLLFRRGLRWPGGDD